MVKETIQHKVVSQPVLYRAQVRALDALLDMFARELGIPKVFPMKDGEYDNSLLDGDVLDGFRGCLARYNYISVNNEPGAGFAASLETIFGEIDRKSEKKSEAARPVVPMFDSSQFDEARRSLAEHPEPTATFGIAHEVDAPFNLSDAIAVAEEYVKAGCDYLQVSSGISSLENLPAFHDTRVSDIQSLGAYFHEHFAGCVPVSCVGGLKEPEQIRYLLENDYVDTVDVARAILADPNFANAVITGGDYVKCYGCKACQFGPFMPHTCPAGMRLAGQQ